MKNKGLYRYVATLCILLFITLGGLLMYAGTPQQKHPHKMPAHAKRIPNVIWTYWDSDKLPDIVARCIDSWRRHNPDWTIHVLNPTNLRQYVDVDIYTFKFANTKPRISDFVRLFVLAKHGGVWCDASIVATKPLEWVHRSQESSGCELVAYFRESATTKPEYPVIESWFFACIPNSPFVNRWRDELCVMNTLEKEEDYKAYVISHGVDIQNIPQPDYLNIYLAAQVVMQLHMTRAQVRRSIYVLKAEDGPLAHSVDHNWRPSESITSLCMTHGSQLPDLIKIYGNERRAIDADPTLRCIDHLF